MCLLTFFKQIPELNHFDVDDKVILMKRNLMSLVILNCTLSYKIETDSGVPWNVRVLPIMESLLNTR